MYFDRYFGSHAMLCRHFELFFFLFFFSKCHVIKISKIFGDFVSLCQGHAIRDSASPRPKMYWTRTFEELVSSLDTTSNLVSSFYLFSGKLEYPNKISRFNTSIVRI